MVPDQQRPKDDTQSIVSHQTRGGQGATTVVLPRSRFRRTADEAEEAENGADQLTSQSRLQSADSQGNQASAEFTPLGSVELGISVELAVDGYKRVEQADVAEDATGKPGQESFERRSNIVNASFDVQGKLGDRTVPVTSSSSVAAE